MKTDLRMCFCQLHFRWWGQLLYMCFWGVLFSSVKCSPQHLQQPHHSRDALPSNGEASSTHALYNQKAVDRRRGGVGGERTVEISAASYNQHRDFRADMSAYRTHRPNSEAIEKLSAQTAIACTVKESRGKTMTSQQLRPKGVVQENINHRSEQITSERKMDVFSKAWTLGFWWMQIARV